MHRIDGPGVVPGGLFTEGDPGTGTPATVLTAAWANAVQEELVGVVQAAGLVLSKPNNAQVAQAIAALIKAATPVGMVIQGYFSAPPPGFLLCDGAAVPRAAYPALWAHAQGAGLVVAEAAWSAGDWTKFGAGNGATTFRLPDLRGEFIRGADFGRGVDGGRALGSWQTDAFKSHSHELGVESGGGLNLATPVDSPGVDESAVGGQSGLTGGAETRPRNVALAFCVRF